MNVQDNRTHCDWYSALLDYRSQVDLEISCVDKMHDDFNADQQAVSTLSGHLDVMKQKHEQQEQQQNQQQQNQQQQRLCLVIKQFLGQPGSCTPTHK
jgi:hypothetical protein